MKKQSLGFLSIMFVVILVLTAGLAVNAATINGGPSEEEAYVLGANEFYGATISGTGITHYFSFTPESSEAVVFNVNDLAGADVTKVSIYSNDPAQSIIFEDQSAEIREQFSPTIGVIYYIKIEMLAEGDADYQVIVFQDCVGNDGPSAMQLEPYNNYGIVIAIGSNIINYEFLHHDIEKAYYVW